MSDTPSESLLNQHIQADLAESGRSAEQLHRIGSGDSGLPCLFSHISIGEVGPETEKHRVLSANNRRSAHVLAESVSLAAKRHGLEKLGFLTLTFAEHITDPKEAQRRLNSLLSNVIKGRYLDYLGVFERQKSGRIHYHLLVAMTHDIRTGFDFDAAAISDYRTASKYMRDEWRFWRRTANKYGFGRTELMPIKSTTEAISRYVGKYISKHITQRALDDKGVRLVRYSRGVRAGTCHFQFLTPGSAEWRAKVALFAEIVQVSTGQKVATLDDLSGICGIRWAHHHRDFIAGLPLDETERLLERAAEMFQHRGDT